MQDKQHERTVGIWQCRVCHLLVCTCGHVLTHVRRLHVQGEYDQLLSVYATLRKEAHKSHGMPIAVRHLESMIRMSEAHARMHLRAEVQQADVQVAIRVMVESFISTQVRAPGSNTTAESF